VLFVTLHSVSDVGIYGLLAGKVADAPVGIGGHRQAQLLEDARHVLLDAALANWVMNARASGEVKLSRGGHTERYKIAEAGAEDAVPEIRVTRPYFDATPSSPTWPSRQNRRGTRSSA
jgi:hypothetical protein